MPNWERPVYEGLALVHDGSWDGLLSAVYDAFASRVMPGAVCGPDCQQELWRSYREVATDERKAQRMQMGVTRTLGGEVYDTAWTAFLAHDPGCSDAIYQYFRFGFQAGRGFHRRLSDDRVLRVNKWDSLVRREAAHLLQFVRFSEREGGVYYAAIAPAYPVLPLLMPHFAARFHTQPFVLHDLRHRQAGAFAAREWVITDTTGLTVPDPTAEEREFSRLWKTFYDRVAIRERTDPKRRQQFMPKKYWANVSEMTLLPDDPESLPREEAPRRLPEQEWRLGEPVASPMPEEDKTGRPSE